MGISLESGGRCGDFMDGEMQNYFLDQAKY